MLESGEGASPDQKFSNANDSIKIIPQEFEDDNLITYKEFVQAVKNIKSTDDPNY